jgi:hypothetical protein
MAIKCPYCGKRLNSVKAVYGHWSWCGAYKEFVKNNGKPARLPFKWVGYTQRHPRNWVDHKVTKKTVDKLGERKRD